MVGDDKYVALQKFWIRFFADGSIFVRCRVEALQDLLFQRDYGPQMVTTGFNTTVMIAGGQQGGRVAWTENMSSGPASAYPDACALTLRNGTNGQLSSWIDRGFGADGRFIDPSQQLVRGGTNTSKMYQLAILTMDGMPMAAGDFYEWRGGYHLSSARAFSGGVDSAIARGDLDSMTIFSDASYM